ncbi:unnamed protein product [Heterobilharzia americana]|nr:unnamed protein product [Heterobilharzia americana]
MIRCTDLGSNPLSTEYVAQIHIGDINDHEPIFQRTDEYITLMEDSEPLRSENNYYIIQINATDEDIDENAKITYYIVEESVKHLIVINETNGVIQTNGNLDRETHTSLSFTVIAKDFGEPSRSSSVLIHITIQDYNDEYPEFDKRLYEFTLAENPVQGYYIDSILVSDKDFGVNSQLSFYLDYNEGEGINYMNDEANYASPQHYELRFPSLQKRSKPPFKLTSKRSNDQHTYELGLFTNGKIDREEVIRRNQRRMKTLHHSLYNNINSEDVETPMNPRNIKEMSFYELILTAEDSGMPKRISTALVYINIMDVNDEAPIFMNPLQEDMIYTFSVNEASGYEILKFQANDPDEGLNAEIKYSLTEPFQLNAYSGNGSSSTCKTLSFKSLPRQNLSCHILEYLHLNQTSGSLTLQKQLPISLSNATCRLRVEASDSGVIPLQTARYFCLHLMSTHESKRIKWISNSNLHVSSFFYGYIITGMIGVGLILSVIFICIAFIMWKYPKFKLDRNEIKDTLSYNDNQTSRIHCVDERPNLYDNEEKYKTTLVCTENEWTNIHSNYTPTNQSEYFSIKDNLFYPYHIESQYNTRNSQFFESLQQNKMISIDDKELHNKQNICVNPNYSFQYSSSLSQQNNLLSYDSM